MHKESKNKTYKRNILGTFGIILLIFGVVSLVYQYPSNVNNAYAQTVELGPLIPVGPPFRSQALDADSPGHDSPGTPAVGDTVSIAYLSGGSIWLGLVNPGAGGRAEALDDAPEEIITGASGAPSIDESTQGQMYIVAARPGESDIAFVECAEDDDSCEEPISASTEAPQIETSCFDGVDNDGDGEADSDDSDCFACFDSGEGGPSLAAFGGMGARLQYVTTIASCPIETGDQCDDGEDNDGDGVADAQDPDCNIEGGFVNLSVGGPNCEDGIDNDGDELTDSNDPGCNEAGEVACSNGIDDDGDGLTDTGGEEVPGDPGCEISEPVGIEGEGGVDQSCIDSVDNDGDGDTDIADPDCQGEVGGLCSDGTDNDGDGNTDFDDPACFQYANIEGEGGINSCGDDFDNDGDEAIDGDDVDCQADSDATGLCSDGTDNDGDGATDQEDPDCDVDTDVPFICTDEIDNDGDELIDMADPGCQQPGGDEFSDSEPVAMPHDNNAILQSASLATSMNTLQATTTTPQLTFVQSNNECTADPSTPRVATDTSGQDVYLVWEDGCGDILFRASHDGGETFGEILNLSNNAGNSVNPRVATSSDGQFVHVTWQDNTPGNEEVFYSRSTNGGETFNGGSPVGTPRNLSNTPRASNDHELLAEGSNVYIVWVDYTTGNGDIYFRRSSNNGETFSSTINLSRGSGASFLASRDPDLGAEGSRVAVVWTAYPSSTGGGPGEIILRHSTNNGNTFTGHIIVSRTPFTDSKEPEVDYTEENEIYAGWHDKGGPRRAYTTSGTYNVLASEGVGTTFSRPVNLSDAPNNPDKTKNTSQLEVVYDVGNWDPTSRRG